MVSMNKLTTEKRVAVVRALVEGCSIRSTCRMTGVSKNTVTKLLVDLGCACSEFQDKAIRGLNCSRIQLDEIWSFVGMKDKNVPEDRRGEPVGDVWTWTAICADSKLIVNWLVGDRDGETAKCFVNDLAKRLTRRVQITSDGHKAYLEAVEDAFGSEVDYGMLVKVYGKQTEEDQRKYSPAKCKSCERHVINGNPNQADISTSYVERQNLTVRMGNRRFTRLTNAFSKKFENHIHALAIHFMYYNFARRHQTLRMSPAMAAGIADRLWTIEDIVGLLPELSYNTRPAKAGD